jgi:hypothetical protein
MLLHLTPKKDLDLKCSNDSTKYFGHFSEAFFTMFQCVSGDVWASGVARPMFESAEATCTYRDEETGKCVFDIGVAIIFCVIYPDSCDGCS